MATITSLVDVDLSSLGSNLGSDLGEEPDVVTRLDALALHPFTPERYLAFFIDYIKPVAYRWRRWMLSDSRLRDAAKTLDFDDFMQIGSEIIWRLTETITEHIDDVDPYVFSAWLKVRIESAFHDAMRSASAKSAEDYPEDDWDPRIRTSVRVKDGDRRMMAAIAECMTDAPTAQRIVLGMFIVEEMRQQDIAELAGVGQATVSRWIKEAAARALVYAQNEVLEHPIDLPDWPTPTPLTIDAVARLSKWITEMYGVDFMTWLDWITRAYSVEPAYIVDVVGIAYGRMVHRRPEAYEFEEDVAKLVLLDPPPRTVQDVVDRCGMNYTRSMKVLRVWRHRHGG